MDNTIKINNKKYADFADALADPLFHFDSWLAKLNSSDEEEMKATFEELKENYDTYDEAFPSYKEGGLKQMYAAFAAGFNSANRVWMTLTEDIEKSSDSTATTETTENL